MCVFKIQLFKESWEGGAYIGEINSHEYSVDAVENYSSHKKWLENNIPRKGFIDKESYLGSLEYEIKNIPVIEKQILNAGIRLSGILNSLFM